YCLDCGKFFSQLADESYHVLCGLAIPTVHLAGHSYDESRYRFPLQVGFQIREYALRVLRCQRRGDDPHRVRHRYADSLGAVIKSHYSHKTPLLPAFACKISPSSHREAILHKDTCSATRYVIYQLKMQKKAVSAFAKDYCPLK